MHRITETDNAAVFITLGLHDIRIWVRAREEQLNNLADDVVQTRALCRFGSFKQSVIENVWLQSKSDGTYQASRQWILKKI